MEEDQADSRPTRARGSWRRRLVILILGLFAAQSVARLGLLIVFGSEGLEVAAYHLAMLVALAALAMLLLLKVPPTRWGRAFVAAILAGMSFLLWSYDVLALASERFGSTFFSFRFLADNWCGSRLDLTCIGRFPAAFLAAGSFILVAATVYFLVLPELRSRMFAMVAAAQRLSSISRVSVPALLALAVGGVMAWNAGDPDRWRDEPLHALFLSRFELGPSELLVGALPDYRLDPSPKIDPRPLVIIMVDSMRADKVGLEAGKPTRTPFLRSLAASGRLHDIGPAFSICTSSYCGILGTLLSASWADMQSRKGPTITQALRAEGYRSSFVVSGKHDRFANVRGFYGPDLAHYSDDYLLDDRAVLARLERLAFGDPDRSFLFIHLMSAHLAGRRFFPEAARQIDSRLSWGVLQEQLGAPALTQYYLEGMQQADEVIRRIFAVLDRKGMLSDALVIITADHGERIGERGMIGHLGTPDPAVSQIPLLIYDPRRTYPARAIASNTDIAPTLLQSIGARIPRQWSGEPLQRQSARTAVAVDSRTVTGAAFRYEDADWFYTCDRITGEETLWRAGVEQESSSPLRPAAITAGRRALRALPPRNDVSTCLR